MASGSPEVVVRLGPGAGRASATSATSVKGAELMARTLPAARHAVIAGAGHLAPLETPEALRGLVLGFLRVEGRHRDRQGG
jgi:pimeloyl-ACP methyl ester carboxylesterase